MLHSIFFLMIRRPPRSTQGVSSAASDVYKRQGINAEYWEECERKYGLEMYKLLIESFYCLPIACIVNRKFLALHGGFSPDLKVLDDLRKLNRNIETPKEGLLCDILWSDPIDDDKGECDPPMKPNNVRSCSYFFGKKALGPFLKKNNLLAIIRAHESLPDGYKMHRWNGPSDFPMVITVFSAPKLLRCIWKQRSYYQI
eukprot:TRINITY_DN43902_c0_g1_i2.p2 TRINITY_DN43902_c0_g1~~TRINITY_DN43902_c0_g1_i2.p2  ORF type:complete len:199 (+),score=26.54 TRINITY_DN43902_c0_g1_i2:60-656(+)